MDEHLDIQVAIRENLRKGLIFGLKARLPIAVILKFSGYQH